VTWTVALRAFAPALLLTALIGCQETTQPARPATRAAAPPSTTEKLIFLIPTEFKIGNLQHNRDTTIAEFVPQGQVITNWSEKITLTVHKAGGTAPVQEFSQLLLKSFTGRCAALQASTPDLQTSKEIYQTSSLSIDCRFPNRSGLPSHVQMKNYEYLIARVFKGRSHLFILQRAWHSDSDEIAPPLRSADIKAEWAEFFGAAQICDDTVAGQPCLIPLSPKFQPPIHAP
jgi:hypothetical protein